MQGVCAEKGKNDIECPTHDQACTGVEPPGDRARNHPTRPRAGPPKSTRAHRALCVLARARPHVNEHMSDADIKGIEWHQLRAGTVLRACVLARMRVHMSMRNCTPIGK